MNATTSEWPAGHEAPGTARVAGLPGEVLRALRGVPSARGPAMEAEAEQVPTGDGGAAPRAGELEAGEGFPGSVINAISQAAAVAQAIAGWLPDVRGGAPPPKATAFVARLIAGGIHDKNKLTDILFWAAHPEADSRRLNPEDERDRPLIKDWIKICDRLVMPELRRRRTSHVAPAGVTAGVTAAQFLARHRNALKERTSRYPASDREMLELLDAIMKRYKDSSFDINGRYSKQRPTLLQLVFMNRYPRKVPGSPHKDPSFTAGDRKELEKIANDLVYPVLRYVLPRITGPWPVISDSSSLGEQVAARAHCYLGVRYKRGARKYNPRPTDRLDCAALLREGNGTLDCSALVNYVYWDVLGRPLKPGPRGGGVDRIKHGGDFQDLGSPESVTPRPGDLLLGWKDGHWNHVGIYVSAGQLIDAWYTGTVVRKRAYIPGRWDRVLRFNGAVPGRAVHSGLLGEVNPQPAGGRPRVTADAPVGPFGTLTVKFPGWEFAYRFTAEDVEWTAKLILLESSGTDDPQNQAVIWAMFNRYALFTHKVRAYPTFSSFIRAYSTTLQPVLRNVKTARAHYDNPHSHYVPKKGAGYYPGTDIPRGQLARHLKFQRTPWSKLRPETRSLAERALKGYVDNPGIGNASEFGSSRIWWKRAHKTRNEPSREEWISFTRRITCSRKRPCSWIGEVPGLDQTSNAFFLDRRTRKLPPNAVRVIPAR